MTEQQVTPIDAPLPSFDFKKEQGQLNAIIEAWTEEDRKVLKRRELRENKRSVQEERQKKTILEDETIIPDRTINSNIRRSKTAYTTYVTQSRRFLLITNVLSPGISIEPLEEWYTLGMKYPRWKSPWFKLIDAMHVHGGAAMEVVYDPSKPMNVSLEYIPREHLIFPLKTKEIQNCPRMLRQYDVTPIQLEQFIIDYQFNEAVAKDIFEKFHRSEDFVRIYRVLMKVQGVVYNAWYTKDNPNDWLRAPRPHDIGLIDFDPKFVAQAVPTMGPQGPQMVPLYMTPQWQNLREQYIKPALLKSYPIFWYPFQEVENEVILDIQGRTSLDLHVQEAMTHLFSNTVNCTTRASNFFPCAENMPGDDPKMSELGPLKPGVIMSRKLTFNQIPWPNPIILSVMQALKVGNADQSGQTDFAATARKDANKTAKEMELATDQANMVITSDMDVFSSPFLQTHALCFNIACQQAVFQLCTPPTHPEMLIGDYNLQPAGDVEVVKRAEDKANAKEFFNIVQGTPAAEKMLIFLIQRFFPDQADEWIETLKTPDLRPLVQQMLAILQNIPPDVIQQLSPEEQSGLGNLITTAQQLVGQPNNNPLLGGTSPTQGKAPQPMHEMQQAS